MQFNLKKYITKKYLNESIQSDIFINKLMNDTGGMFKYYQNPESTSVKKYVKLQKDLYNIIYKIFINISSYKTVKDGKVIYVNQDFNMPDNNVKALHKKYMDEFNEIVKTIYNLLNRPDPTLLSAIIAGPSEYSISFKKNVTDLFNITDVNFSTYKFKDLKGNKALQTKVYTLLNNYFGFFLSNNKIEAVSRYGRLILLPIDSPNLYHSYDFKQVSEDLKKYIDNIKKEDIIKNRIYLKLKSDEILEFPLIEEPHFLFNNYGDEGVTAKTLIEEYLNINSSQGLLSNLISSKFKIGKVMSKASLLQKWTKWGNSPEDEIIIYVNTQPYSDDEHNSKINQGEYSMDYYTSTEKGYNEIKHSGTIVRRKQQRDDFKEQSAQTYKWIKDILGVYKPYAGGKQTDIWKYGKKMADINYKMLYRDDLNNNKLVNDNISRYKLLIDQAKSLKNTKVFSEQLKNLLAQINQFVVKGQNLIGKIKTTYKEDKDKFKSLMLLYGVFNKTLNIILSRYYNIQITISNFNEEFNIKNIHNKKDIFGNIKSNEDINDEIKENITDITNKINDLNKYIPQLTEINDKINTILEE